MKTLSTELKTSSLSAISSCSSKQQHSKRTHAPITGGGFPKGLKCRSTATRVPGSCLHTISRLTKLLATCSDEQYIKVINQFQEGWSCMNDKGTKVTKRQIEMAQWGAYKDDHIVLTFQQTIMNTRQCPNTVTQYDTLLAQSIVDQNDVWTRHVTNPLTEEHLQHPLQNTITIMQIYNSQHYTTLITDNNNYCYYDGLGIPVPNTLTHLHNHLRQWYGSSTLPPALQNNFPTVHTPFTPQ